MAGELSSVVQAQYEVVFQQRGVDGHHAFL